MQIAAFDLLPKNPLRPVDWRWQRAGQLAGNAPFSRTQDDGWTKSAGQFRRLRQVPNAGLHGLLQKRGAAIFMATKLAEERAPAYQHMRAELEARILAGENDFTLSQRFGFMPEAVEAYERLFFDCRTRLIRPSFILHFVIGSDTTRLTEQQFSQLWKMFGYYTGPDFLDALITGFDDREMLVGLSTPEAFDSLISTKRRQKGFLAVLGTQLNPMTAQTIWDGYDKLRQIEHTAASAGVSRSAILTNIDAMLSKVQPFVLGRSGGTLVSSVVAKYETTCELRAGELAMLSAGHDLPHAAGFADMRFSGEP